MPSSGLMELVAHGVQDIFLIGNPQITFFKSIYKRHTNFAMEAFQISYDAKPGFGSKTTFNISRYADLIHTMILEVDLPLLTAIKTFDSLVGNPSDYDKGMGFISWVNNTGHALINYADILIGKQLIDRHYGEWMEIWTQLTQSESKKRGLDLMLNRNSSLIVQQGPFTTYIPFHFWFCRNLGLTLPLIALQYHNIELEINFRNLSQLYTFGANTYYTATSDGTNILKVYKALSTTPNLDDNSQAFKVVFPNNTEYFIHPTLHIGGPNQTGLPGFPYLLQVTQPVPIGWTNSVIYIKPNGVLDISKGMPEIVDIRLFVDYIYLDTVEQKEFASAKHRYLIEQVQFSGAQSISSLALTNRLKLNFNLPIKELFWVNQLDDIYKTNDLFNYSNTVDPYVPPNNIMADGLIYINGIERFKMRSGNFFRLIQPYFKHTRSSNDFVYIYSFSIKPEEHQPSGCSNFSKLDTKEIFQIFNKNIGSQQIRVYGLNYNVLRIESGMGGLGFSS